MKETERKPKVTLEDLLLIKRAERPPADFWPEFERTLRTKQLAAIVETRPWWRNVATRKSLVRVWVPLSATALVAMTFASFRGFRSQVGPSEAVAAVAPNRLVAVATSSEALSDRASEPGEISDPTPVAMAVVASSVGETHAEVNDTSSPVAQGADAKSAESKNFAIQAFAPNSVIEVLAQPTFVQMLGRAISVTSHTSTPRAPIEEPLAQVATPRDNRRARLLAYAVTFDPHAADSSDAVRSRERITHRLSDDAVYDSITRLGVNGNRLSIKF
jgi:hypothetical protein